MGVQQASGIPTFRQQLTLEENMLKNTATLFESGLLHGGSVLQLVLPAVPEPSEISDAIASIRDVKALIRPVCEPTSLVNVDGRYVGRPQVLMELCSLNTPPPPCLIVCSAVMHLLAGTEPSVAIKSDGSVVSASWQGCVMMLQSASFG